jgi:protein involved in polysaccharide export with SLBB domain
MRLVQFVAVLVASLSVAACSTAVLDSAPPSGPCPLSGPPRVQVFGGVKRPGALAYEPGLTVYAAIERAGGLERDAHGQALRILRCGQTIGPFPSPQAAGVASDLRLERGDVLEVPLEMF